MDADRVGLDSGQAAIDRFDGAVFNEAQHTLGDELGIVQHGAWFAARDEGALGRIGTVSERFGDTLQTLVTGQFNQA
ncbi:hypothetical protein D3C84_440940 [compost metagenome]